MEGRGSGSVQISTSPDQGDPKTYGSYGSESGNLVTSDVKYHIRQVLLIIKYLIPTAFKTVQKLPGRP
jgi:hypothetical protein